MMRITFGGGSWVHVHVLPFENKSNQFCKEVYLLFSVQIMRSYLTFGGGSLGIRLNSFRSAFSILAKLI